VCAALCGSALGGSVWQCARQCAAVRLVVYGSRAQGSVCQSGSVRAVCAFVCDSAVGSVWQCARQCAAVYGSVRQCAALCGSVRQCATVCNSAAVLMWQCSNVRQLVMVCAAVCSSVGLY
jgi:hypothetical protein